ncbi:hypothetical protein NQZ79_g7195 [Umbelopsis isabellina]|nr:hypothetical protein NQZ79_g7195 [Umbelopsis isabellina]
MLCNAQPNFYYPQAMSPGDMGKTSQQGFHTIAAESDYLCSSYSVSQNFITPAENSTEIDFFSYARDVEFDDALFEVDMEMCLEEFEEEEAEHEYSFCADFHSRLHVDATNHSSSQILASEAYISTDDEWSLISSMSTPPLQSHDSSSDASSDNDSIATADISHRMATSSQEPLQALFTEMELN